MEELQLNQENAYDLAQENLGTSVVEQKCLYNWGATDEPYAKADLVWLVKKSRCKERCPKLQPKWLGPMLVVEMKL